MVLTAAAAPALPYTALVSPPLKNLPIGWMVMRVLDALVCRREQGLSGPLTAVDLVEAMPAGLRQQLVDDVGRR